MKSCLLIAFLLGYGIAFAQVEYSAIRRVEVEKAKNADARAFMQAAKSPDIWDSLLTGK